MKNKEIVEVYCQKGEGRKLARQFGCHETTVSFALRGKTNTKLSKKIRQAAVNNGGLAIYK